MKRPVTREQRQALKAENRKWSRRLTPIPREQWPAVPDNGERHAVMRSREFLVQIVKEKNAVRITVNRTELDADGDWKDGITWDELQSIKSELGYGAMWAVEIYPPNTDLVNVGNLRHLWLTEKPPFAWSKR